MTHKQNRHKVDIALGLIMNTRTAKYLTPRLSSFAANTHKPTHAQIHTRVHQKLTHAIPFESGMTHYTAALILKQILILDTT